MRLILFLSITDMLAAIVFMYGVQKDTVKDEDKCIGTALAIEYTSTCSMLWTACIAHTLDSVIRKHNHHIESNEKWYHLVCWGLPTGCILFLISTQKYLKLLGSADLWCWIDGAWWVRAIFFYIPLVVILTYIAVIYVIVSHTLSKENSWADSEIEEDRSQSILITFRWYLLSLAICWLPAIINRAQNALSDERWPWLFGMHAFLVPLQGFFNALIYGFNDEVRSKLARYFWCLRCRPRWTGGTSFLSGGSRDSTNLLRDAINENYYYGSNRNSVASYSGED